ncbi:DUF4349 domain-containing protein [Herbiconiux sp. VKM Ac-2851]|nr:DUF4349 domain-containing protein [Herbiconiux sp. VKM Ac-2851]
MILASAAVASALVLAGCSAGGSSSSQSDGVPYVDGQRVDPAQPAPEGGISEGGVAADGSGESLAESDQSVITTGWITITVDDPAAATDDAVALVASLDGRIDSRSQQAGSDDQQASSQLTIRVPADSVDKAVDGLRELGDVESVSISTSDVTLQVRDLDAQISALEASVDRLLDLVGSAATTADLIELETAISDRQGQLDSLKSEKQYLSDQIDYSTLTLDLQQKGALPSAVPGDFWSGLAAGWASLVAAASGFLVLVGVLIPWLLPLAVIAAIVLLIVALVRRGSRRPGPPASTGSSAPVGAARADVPAPTPAAPAPSAPAPAPAADTPSDPSDHPRPDTL